MKNSNLLIVLLTLCVVFLGIVIVSRNAPILQTDERAEYEKEVADVKTMSAMESADAYRGETGTTSEDAIWEKTPEDVKKLIRFDLKYDKYLIPEPYIYESDGKPRVFQFEKMAEVLEKADAEFAKGKLTYVDNYKNQNGYAPYYHGKSVDGAGNSRSASVPAYFDASDREEFMYIPDGTLVRIIEEGETLTKIAAVDNGNEYFVPNKYVRDEFCLTDLNKAIVVDRSNQNIAVFEKRTYETKGHKKEKAWTVVSYSLATTGKVGRYHQPTPLGYFYAIEKRERFYYLKDGTNAIEGYAPYAIRFTAGAYIHGIATAYKYREDGTRSDPGISEFSQSIGTIPLSHKCVRNYTSHAKFIYDWYVHGQTIVVVIE